MLLSNNTSEIARLKQAKKHSNPSLGLNIYNFYPSLKRLKTSPESTGHRRTLRLIKAAEVGTPGMVTGAKLTDPAGRWGILMPQSALPNVAVDLHLLVAGAATLFLLRSSNKSSWWLIQTIRHIQKWCLTSNLTKDSEDIQAPLLVGLVFSPMGIGARTLWTMWILNFFWHMLLILHVLIYVYIYVYIYIHICIKKNENNNDNRNIDNNNSTNNITNSNINIQIWFLLRITTISPINGKHEWIATFGFFWLFTSTLSIVVIENQ